MSKRILVIVSSKNAAYLKCVEECNTLTIENALRAGYLIVSRNSKGVTEALTERPYEDAENAKNAAEAAGINAISYQKLAASVRPE